MRTSNRRSRSARRWLVLLALAALAGSGCDGSLKREPRPRSIILFSIDTVRFDVLAGLDPDEFPHLRRIADEGAWFRNFYAASTFTTPSHMSIFTGLDPEAHGVRDEGSVVEPSVSFLAERLRSSGYYTQAFHEGGYVGAEYGFARGFERYEELPRLAVIEDSLPRVLDWMQTFAEKPYFLFLHTYAAHGPYGGWAEYVRSAPQRNLPSDTEIESLAKRIDAGDGVTAHERDALLIYNQLADTRFAKVRGVPSQLPEAFANSPHFDADLAAMKRAYRRRIGRIDAALGRIQEALVATGQWNDTLLVVTADHGEAFFEHGLHWHGAVPYNEVLKVPLLVSWPRWFAGRGPVVVDRLAWHLDLYPTLLALAGLTAEPNRSGVDLSADILGTRRITDRETPRAIFPVVDEVPFRRSAPPYRVVVSGPLKLIQNGTGRRQQGELFDLDRDPGENNDLRKSRRADARKLAALADAYREKLEHFGRPREDATNGLSEERRRQLEDLGYVQ